MVDPVPLVSETIGGEMAAAALTGSDLAGDEVATGRLLVTSRTRRRRWVAQRCTGEGPPATMAAAMASPGAVVRGEARASKAVAWRNQGARLSLGGPPRHDLVACMAARRREWRRHSCIPAGRGPNLMVGLGFREPRGKATTERAWDEAEVARRRWRSGEICGGGTWRRAPVRARLKRQACAWGGEGTGGAVRAVNRPAAQWARPAAAAALLHGGGVRADKEGESERAKVKEAAVREICFPSPDSVKTTWNPPLWWHVDPNLSGTGSRSYWDFSRAIGVQHFCQQGPELVWPRFQTTRP